MRVGLAQLRGADLNAEEARARGTTAARQLFTDGADLVVLPELGVPGYVLDRDRLERAAEALDGPTVAAWVDAAGESGGLICGGFCERAGDQLFNTAVVVGGDGVELVYRKLHPFAEEKQIFTPGDLGLPVLDTPLGRIGVCVCYDLRFVETVRALALQGADLICVPTAWIAGFDQELWDESGLAPQAHGALLQANLSQVFIACASAVGTVGDTVFLGSSIVADPHGKALLGPLPTTEETRALATIDLAAALSAQTRSALVTPRADRRTDVYRLALGDQLL